MLPHHGRNVAQTALRELTVMSRDRYGWLHPMTSAGVCVMVSDQWWTAVAIGEAEKGWVGASTYYAVSQHPDTYPVLWHHTPVADPTEVYFAFRDCSTHDPKLRPPAVTEIQFAQLLSQSHRAWLHLLACSPGFNPEGSTSPALDDLTFDDVPYDDLAPGDSGPSSGPSGLAVMAGPAATPEPVDTNPNFPTLALIDPPLDPFAADGTDARIQVAKERCWLRWASTALTRGPVVVDGQGRDFAGTRVKHRFYEVLDTPTRPYDGGDWGLD